MCVHVFVHVHVCGCYYVCMCVSCVQVICSRCKNVCRMLNGQNRVLCTVCHEEREVSEASKVSFWNCCLMNEL